MARLRAPQVHESAFEDAITFLKRQPRNATNPIHGHLCQQLIRRLKEVVNPYRHLTSLDDIRELADLRDVQRWLTRWVNVITSLPCAEAAVAPWHRTYDLALYQALLALITQRRGAMGEASKAWFAAATICRRWVDTNRDQATTKGFIRLEADYYFFEARAHKSLGHAALDMSPRSAAEFDAASLHFEEAARNMTRSMEIVREATEAVAIQEVHQLEFMVAITKYRAALFRHDWETLDSVLTELKQLAPLTRMKRLPYFETAEWIDHEPALVAAFKATVEGQVSQAHKTMRELQKIVISSGPRRQRLATRAAAVAILTGDSAGSEELTALLHAGWCFHPADQLMALTCNRFLAGQTQLSEAVGLVANLFPLDAQPPEGTELGSHVIWGWLPPFYQTWLNVQDDDESLASSLYVLWHYTAMIAEFLCALYEVKRARGVATNPLKIPRDLRLLNFEDLHELLESLRVGMSWTGNDLKELATSLTISTSIVATLVESRGDALASNVKRIVARTAASLLPFQGEVLHEQLADTGRYVVQIREAWRDDGVAFELVCREPRGLASGDRVFLKPPFKTWMRRPRQEETTEVFNIYRAATIQAPGERRWILLVEGRNDLDAFERLLDHFVPFWRARISIMLGGGDALPEAWRKQKKEGHSLFVVADGDKRGKWDYMKPQYLDPDFEGTDPESLSIVAEQLWAATVGVIDSASIRAVLANPPPGSTIEKLRRHWVLTLGAALPDEEEMKKELSVALPKLWISGKRVPEPIKVTLLQLLNIAFGLRGPSGEAGRASADVRLGRLT